LWTDQHETCLKLIATNNFLIPSCEPGSRTSLVYGATHRRSSSAQDSIASGKQPHESRCGIMATRAQHKIRLAGIDAAEKRQAFGNVSKQNLSRMVFKNEVIVDFDSTVLYVGRPD
jgi:endonuclease YncB( thermonuclease family)